MKKSLVTILFLSLGILSAKPVVTTTILPTKFFVESIAKDTLDVNTMVGPGADPHTYEPKPEQMKALEKSDIFFSVGIEFDQVWLDKFKKQFPKLMIVDTSKGIEKIAMVAHHHHDEDEDHDEHEHEHHHDHDAHHDHEDHDEHEHHHHHHGGLDPHIWTDPILVKVQAKNILDALEEKYPKNKDFYEKNYKDFIASLDSLDAYAKEKLADKKGKKFIVYHPSWGYFAKRYGLIQLPIEIEGKDPKPKEIKHLIDEIKEEKIKVIFVAPQFSQKVAKQIAKETNSKVVEIDQLPLNWDKEMRKVIDVLSKI